MKITQTQLTLGLGIVGLMAVYFVGRKTLQGAATVANAVNPLNQNNVFAGSVNALGGQLVTDPNGAGKNADGSWTLGGWLFDITHPATAKEVAGMSGTVQKKNISDPALFTPADNTSVPAAYDYGQVDGMGNYVGP